MRIEMRLIFLLFFIGFSCTATAQESYKLSPESILTISGTSTVSDWEVTANSIKGSMTGSDEVINDLKIEVPVAEIKSERGATMDDKMYAALKEEEHPMISFTLNESVKKDIIGGMLIIAGVEKEIQITRALGRDEGKMGISGVYDILLKDYGIEPPTAMFGQIVVGEAVTVTFDLTFQRD